METNKTTIPLNGASRTVKDANYNHNASNEDCIYLLPINDEATKIDAISRHFSEIMRLLGLDLSKDSLRGTPDRVAKMYVNEIFSGLDPRNAPDLTLFENTYAYNEMLLEKNITVYSVCEHHFVPIIGKAHVAYFPNGKVIGLSKINRIVQYYSRKPQVQEKLTVEIATAMKSALATNDVAVVIEAAHLCVASRGVGDVNSTTFTSHYSGRFDAPLTKKEFLSFLK